MGYMESKMQDQIEAGIALKDAFDAWFLQCQEIALHGYGCQIPDEEESEYYTYFRRGWTPDDTMYDVYVTHAK